ncbi:MAG: preprotein translocase subunit YajC [Mycobacteriales bacterium]
MKPVQAFAVVLAAETKGSGSLFSLLIPLLLLGAFFLFVVRPQRQRQRAFLQVQGSLTEGQEVVTTAGLYGTIAEVGTDFVLLEVAPGVRVKLARAAVGQVLTNSQAAPELPPEDRA